MTTIKFFHAPWCGPCSEQEPILNDLNDEIDDLTVEEYDIETDEGQAEAQGFNVRSVPTLVLFNDSDEVVSQLTGLMQEDDLKEEIRSAEGDTTTSPF